MACLHAVHSQISIHAPPRGATGQEKHLTGRAHFNSRPSARGDVSIFMRTFCDDEFQFTPLRGGDAAASMMAGLSSYFNSRPSARGDDLIVCDDVVNLNISIHAPPRGATPSASTYSVDRIFQFTPLREGRLAPVLLASKP